MGITIEMAYYKGCANLSSKYGAACSFFFIRNIKKLEMQVSGVSNNNNNVDIKVPLYTKALQGHCT